jgi:hypothetical protein
LPFSVGEKGGRVLLGIKKPSLLKARATICFGKQVLSPRGNDKISNKQSKIPFRVFFFKQSLQIKDNSILQIAACLSKKI